MKKIIMLILVLFCTSAIVYADLDPQGNIVFTDANFKAALIASGLDTNLDGEISESEAKSARELRLYGKNISNLEGIKYFTNATELILGDNSVSDISELVYLTKLRMLSMFNNNVSSLDALENITSLEKLVMTNNNISTISPLANLTNMTELSISQNNIVNLYGIENLTKITFLSLSDNNLSTISGASSLVELERIFIDGNNISDISELSTLSKVDMMYIDDNNITSIEPLSTMSNLQSVTMSDNQISDMNPLYEISGLTSINIARNNIHSLGQIWKLDNLSHLNLDGNNIYNKYEIWNLYGVDSLSLQNMGIRDVSRVEFMDGLNGINLKGNNVSDIYGIAKNETLRKSSNVNIEDNPLNDSTTPYAEHLSDLDFTSYPNEPDDNSDGKVTYEVWHIDPMKIVDLKYISFSSGNLNPSFDNSIKEYTLSLPYEVNSVTASAVSVISGAASNIVSGPSIFIDGTETREWNPNVIVDLDVGVNKVPVVVLGDKNHQNMFNIIVTRDGPRNALKGLKTNIDKLTPDFKEEIYTYKITGSSVNIEANDSIMIYPSLKNSSDDLYVNGIYHNDVSAGVKVPVKIGENNIFIKVLTQNLPARVYTIDLDIPNNGLYLDYLKINEGNLSPSFSPNIKNYDLSVKSESITISAGMVSVASPGAISVNGVSMPNRGSIDVPLRMYSNEVNIDIELDGNINTYKLNVMRIPSSNAKLKGLQVNVNGNWQNIDIARYDKYIWSSITGPASHLKLRTYISTGASVIIDGLYYQTGQETERIENAKSYKTIPIIVEAEDKSVNNYTLSLYDNHPDHDLSLNIESGSIIDNMVNMNALEDLDISSGAETTSGGAIRLNIYPRPADYRSSVYVEGQYMPKYRDTPVLIDPDKKRIKVLVYYSDGSSKTYIIRLKR